MKCRMDSLEKRRSELYVRLHTRLTRALCFFANRLLTDLKTWAPGERQGRSMLVHNAQKKMTITLGENGGLSASSKFNWLCLGSKPVNRNLRMVWTLLLSHLLSMRKRLDGNNRLMFDPFNRTYYRVQ